MSLPPSEGSSRAEWGGSWDILTAWRLTMQEGSSAVNEGDRFQSLLVSKMLEAQDPFSWDKAVHQSRLPGLFTKST